MTPAVIAAVILAGGRSRRMGQDKAWLSWGGRPLLTHVASVLGEACAPVIVVAAADQTLPPTAGARVVRDPPDHPHEGPLRGLAVGLAAALEEGCSLAFVCGCDAPFVSDAHVRALRDALGPDDEAAAAEHDGYLQVLSSVVRLPAVLASTHARIDAGARSVQALFETLRVKRVEPTDLPDPLALRTCNTPEELRALRRLAFLP